MATIVIAGIVGAVAFVAGLLVGRTNKSKVEALRNYIKELEAKVSSK